MLEQQRLSLVALESEQVTSTPAAVLVPGDPQRLRQVIDNLLRNVRTPHPPGTAASMVIRTGPSMTQLSVEDEGPGIDPEHLEHIFDRFWRHDTSRTRSTGGTGLGLPIAAGIVAAHGGTLTAGNRPEGGARFTIELPTQLARPLLTERLALTGPNSAGPRTFD